MSHRKCASSDIWSSCVNRRMTKTHLLLSTAFWSLLWAHVLTAPHLNKKSDLNSLFTGGQLWKPQSVLAKYFAFVLWQFEKNHRLNAQKSFCISLRRTLHCLRGGSEAGQLVEFYSRFSKPTGWNLKEFLEDLPRNDRRKVIVQGEQILRQIYSF